MKKWTYLVSGVVIGAVVATAGNAFADQVKSMIGKKVTGEYVVIVDGKALPDKGAVIDGKTNVPVRSMTQALGVDFKVDGKKIIVTTDEDDFPEATPPSELEEPVTNGNKYMGSTKKSLEEVKYDIENRSLAPLYEGRKNIIAEISVLKKSGDDVPILAVKEKRLKEYDAMIAKNLEELRLVNEALAAHEK